MTTKAIRAEAHKEITYIFEELLPEHGMTHRPEQVKLSHLMLDAMIEGKIALCDAGTGIGKTFSYLVAGTVYNHYRTRNISAKRYRYAWQKARRINRFRAFFRLKIFHFSIDIKYDSEPFTPI